MQGPERYLVDFQPRLECPVTRRAAKLDSSLRVMVNHDVFFFADARAKRKFVEKPLRYCKLLTDVVTRERFTPGAQSPHVEYHGRAYYFAHSASMAQFQATPDSFAVRKGM